MNSPQVISIGEALIDIIDEPGQALREVPGGSPANVALTLSRLGRSALLHTWIGEDAHGRAIGAHLRASGVEISDESWGAHHTPTAHAHIATDGQATYTFDLAWEPPAPLPLPESAGIVHAGSIATVLAPGSATVAEALTSARTHALVTLDPNVRPAIMADHGLGSVAFAPTLAQADLVKVSDEDIDWIRSDTDGVPSRDAVVESWLEGGVSVVVMTAGKDGAYAWAASGARAHVPADPSVVVVDTVGAGDSFMGGVLDQMLADGLSGADARATLQSIDTAQLERLLRRGAQVADVTVSRAGANPPTSADLGEAGPLEGADR